MILSWNDEAVSTAAQVEGKLSAAQPGTEVSLTLWRDGSERKVKVKLDRALDALVRMNLVKVLSNEAVEKAMAERKYPTIEADRLKAAPIKPDEIELAEGELMEAGLPTLEIALRNKVAPHAIREIRAHVPQAIPAAGNVMTPHDLAVWLLRLPRDPGV